MVVVVVSSGARLLSDDDDVGVVVNDCDTCRFGSILFLPTPSLWMLLILDNVVVNARVAIGVINGKA